MLNNSQLYLTQFNDRTKLLSYLRTIGFLKCSGDSDLVSLNANSDNLSCVKAVLVTGLYPNVIRIDKKNKMLKNE